MQKLLSGILGFVLLGAVLAPMPAQSAEIVMKISLPSPMVEWTQFNEPYAVLKSEIEKRSNGRIEVQLYPAGQLGDMTSGVEQVKKGIIQGVQVGDGWIANHFPEIQVISIPYIFQDRDVAWKVLDGPFGKEMMDAYVEKDGTAASAPDGKRRIPQLFEQRPGDQERGRHEGAEDPGHAQPGPPGDREGPGRPARDR